MYHAHVYYTIWVTTMIDTQINWENPVAFCTSYLICHCLFKGVEKSEAKEGWELSKGDVLLGSSLLDFHETENAKYWSGDSRKPQWTATRLIKIPKWNERPSRLPDF